MTNEIKEILELIGSCCYYGKISEVECEKYCNYITNLQEENEKLKEKLKNNGIVKTCENCEWFGVCPHSYREYDYKSRNEKAVEYIEKHKRKDEFLNLNEWQTRDLSNILRGDE